MKTFDAVWNRISGELELKGMVPRGPGAARWAGIMFAEGLAARLGAEILGRRIFAELAASEDGGMDPTAINNGDTADGVIQGETVTLRGPYPPVGELSQGTPLSTIETIKWRKWAPENRLLSAPTTYRMPGFEPFDADLVTVEAVERGEERRWAIRRLSECMSKSGRWDHEPIPRRRTVEWMADHRWSSADEAARFWESKERTLREGDVVTGWPGVPEGETVTLRRGYDSDWRRGETGKESP